MRDFILAFIYTLLACIFLYIMYDDNLMRLISRFLN